MVLEIGDLIAVRGDGWIAHQIEKVTGGPYSHVAIYVGGGLVYEAQGGRTVGSRCLLDYAGQYDVYRPKMPLTEVQKASIISKLVSMRGRQYDYIEIAVLYLRYKLGWYLVWHPPRRVICETLARDAYLAAAVAVPVDACSPGDLAKWDGFEKMS